MARRVLNAAAIANRQFRGPARRLPDRDAEYEYTRLQSNLTSGRGSDKIPTLGMIFMNPNPAVNMDVGQSWVISDIVTSPTAKGHNWEYYRSKLLAMGYPAAAWIDTTDAAGLPAFQVGGTPYGDAACALASLFDKVAIGHWPSDNVVTRIKELAARYGRTIEVGNYFINYETINQGLDFVPIENYMRAVVKQHLIDGTGLNSQGRLISVDSVVADGAGYTTGDVITLATGAGTARRRATVTVTAVAGAVTAATVTDAGAYNVAPADPVAQFFVLPAGGLGATFNCTFTGGCIKVDLDETGHQTEPVACPSLDAAGFTHHIWYADCSDLSGAEALELRTVLSGIIGAHYPINRPAFVLVDNGLDRPNWGTATNEPVVADATFVAYYKLFMDQLDNLTGVAKWSNRGEITTTTYSAATMPNRYGEFYLHTAGDPSNSTSKTLATLQSELITARNNGILIALDHGYKAGEVDLWSTSTGPGGTKGTWSDLRDHMMANGLHQNMIAVALRTSSGFYAKWQPEAWGVL